jgi:hypothetical protein
VSHELFATMNELRAYKQVFRVRAEQLQSALSLGVAAVEEGQPDGTTSNEALASTTAVSPETGQLMRSSKKRLTNSFNALLSQRRYGRAVLKALHTCACAAH